MAQIFKPSANVLAKLSLFVAGATPVIVLLSGSMISRSPSNTGVGVPITQPVPFSHLHHAFELGIDCRYCHTTVEKSPFAGFPTTETCMSCHSQIWTNSPLLKPVRDSWENNQPIEWVRVNKAPEFVYFDHSIHINRGVNCNTCHGPVQKMPLTYKGQPFAMVWCLDCHREPEKYLYVDEKNPQKSPRQSVFDLYWKYQSNAELTPQERSILNGDNLPKNPDHQKGLERVEELGIMTRQLEDCWTCHR